MSEIRSDYLVIGSGIAGLSFALKVAEFGTVNIITKAHLDDTNTALAQGGVAAVISADDDIESHVRDTHIAGAGLCHEDAVDVMVSEAPRRIRELLDYGVPFDLNMDGGYDLAREGGHSRYRILHVADETGRSIQEVLIRKVRENPNITIYEEHMAVELITDHHVLNNLQSAFNICFGAYVLDERNEDVRIFRADYIMLASGGASRVYLHTTNPNVATGDGIAMAYRAGVRIANMEFVQFHPTALYNPGNPPFLISEACRGFGAYLRNGSGERFMEKYDNRLELAPRDIVARAIDAECKSRGDACAYLDMTHLPGKKVLSHFPNITAQCREQLRIDISKELIPVVPAAHYVCGGIMTNLNGQTSMHNLFAAGETAHTGVHGANRLASNSLLEALVFAHRAAKRVIEKKRNIFNNVYIPDWDDTDVTNQQEWRLVRNNRSELQTIMWDYVGIVRSTVHLNRALRRMSTLYDEIEDYYRRTRINKDMLELRNLSAVAYLIVRSALRRSESRGLHYMSDYPEKDDKFLKDTII
ncbi:MAG: L-aspartate oxidase [Candidatus Marinimicrobia bacterium]|nr:L-aspartate oxidase [Candidatus Neomarinimicrobiota bacterium]